MILSKNGKSFMPISYKKSRMKIVTAPHTKVERDFLRCTKFFIIKTHRSIEYFITSQVSIKLRQKTRENADKNSQDFETQDTLHQTHLFNISTGSTSDTEITTQAKSIIKTKNSMRHKLTVHLTLHREK